MKARRGGKRRSRRFVCVACPLGCELTVRAEEGGGIAVSGHRCRRGVAYARDEVTDPRRTVTTTVRVAGGVIALLPVKSRQAVPVAMLRDVVRAAGGVTVRAPVAVGEAVLRDVAGTGVDLVAARSCPVRDAGEEVP